MLGHFGTVDCAISVYIYITVDGAICAYIYIHTQEDFPFSLGAQNSKPCQRNVVVFLCGLCSCEFLVPGTQATYPPLAGKDVENGRSMEKAFVLKCYRNY